MSDNTEDDVVVDSGEAAAEAEALAAAMAGYKARAQAPADEQPAAPPAPVEQPGDEGDANTSADTAPTDPPQQPEVPNLLDDEPDSATAPEPTLAQALADLRELKAAVKSSSGDSDAIRKLHGEIGAITRMLHQLGNSQPPQAPNANTAPVDDEVTAAIGKAKKVAEDFPEIGGPLVEALEATAKRAGQPMSAEEISALVNTEAQRAAEQTRITLAQEALAEEHPDWDAVPKTPAFQKWLAAQPEDYREKLKTTWNPAVVSKGLTEFKAELVRQQKAREQKQQRLAGAVVPPRGDTSKSNPSTIPDEDGFAIGYNSVRRLGSATNVKR